MWSARATGSHVDEYLGHFREQVLPGLRTLSGFAGARVLSRPLEDRTEIVVLTFWRSMEAIRTFAAPDPEAAVVTAEAARILADYDRVVRHFEVALDAAGGA